ncbi:hypothetical protein MKK75_17680 [Methylobacterium sp. J-030]|uniref:hypothetical protein n=1 Tax=Methylobacterium sp. J-030 TaxID=2836627 RepID=UPI001FBAA344|nr:hypothetical protein [Methylobacterium sp. J-030]MCJ2070601.1 hypothetical protein [Methylobacterium sp. J-030]
MSLYLNRERLMFDPDPASHACVPEASVTVVPATAGWPNCIVSSGQTPISPEPKGGCKMDRKTSRITTCSFACNAHAMDSFERVVGRHANEAALRGSGDSPAEHGTAAVLRVQPVAAPLSAKIDAVCKGTTAG